MNMEGISIYSIWYIRGSVNSHNITLIHSLSQYLQSPQYMPGLVLDAGATTMSETWPVPSQSAQSTGECRWGTMYGFRESITGLKSR